MTWACPYCGNDFGENPDPSPTSIACCGEIGHLMEVDDDGNEVAEKVAAFEAWLSKGLASGALKYAEPD